MNKCVCTVLIFSGRPDPTWELKESIREEFEKIWKTLEPIKKEPKPVPSLGYRGCIIRCNKDIEWFAYEGVVTLKKKGISESHLDIDRKFEKFVINSAPKGLIPISLIFNA
jgi:hypothetical protein